MNHLVTINTTDHPFLQNGTTSWKFEQVLTIQAISTVAVAYWMRRHGRRMRTMNGSIMPQNQVHLLDAYNSLSCSSKGISVSLGII